MDRSRRRGVVLVAAVVLALAAVVVALGGGPGSGTRPPSSTTPSSRPGSPGLPSPSTAPRPTASLPAVPTATPPASPSGRPEGIVARRIRIERLGIDLQVVEGDGVDAPLRKAAHYPGTGWPGGGTNIYLYGHAQEGMFLALWDAKVGDEVVLDLKDGTSRRYVVTDVRPRVPWNALEYLEPTPTERLTLQTSTSYTPTAPRFIVIAEPAP